MKISKITVLLAAMGLSLSNALAQTKWEMPAPYPDTNFHTKNANQFAQEIRQATNGKLTITVHSNGSLIKHSDIKRAVQTGQVPIGELLISVQANESPLYAFDSNPFLAPNYDAARKLWVAAKGPLENRLKKQGITLLYSVPWPPQGLYTKDPITSIADLKGMKFRTYSPITSRLAELLGAIPTTVQVPEVPQAFRTGMVDAMLTAASTGVDTQAWDYLNYFYDVKASMPHNMVIVNTAAFEKLDQPSRDHIIRAAADAEARGWELSREDHDLMIQVMKDKGIKVEDPSPQLAKEFNEIGKKLTQEWLERAGNDGANIIADYQK